LPSSPIALLARSRSFSNLSFLNRFAWIFGRFLNDSRSFIVLCPHSEQLSYPPPSFTNRAGKKPLMSSTSRPTVTYPPHSSSSWHDFPPDLLLR